MNMDYPEVLVNNADHWGGGLKKKIFLQPGKNISTVKKKRRKKGKRL